MGYKMPQSQKDKIKNSNLGEKGNSWKGGRIKRNGYFMIYQPNHPLNVDRYVFEHRLVVEKQIGRYLTYKEVVHHINKIKKDNRPINLMAFTSDSAHQRFEQ